MDRSWATRLQKLAERLHLRPGEVTELLERLQSTSVEGVAGAEGAAVAAGARDAGEPQRWERRLAQPTSEAYAARKRAVTRIARLGRLGQPE